MKVKWVLSGWALIYYIYVLIGRRDEDIGTDGPYEVTERKNSHHKPSTEASEETNLHTP